jgi:hypothetical protein
VEYWKPVPTLASSNQVPSPDCISYNRGALQITNQGASGWLLTDGSSRLLVLDSQQDAENALKLARQHNRQCFIGRGNSRPNRADYIVQYWSLAP